MAENGFSFLWRFCLLLAIVKLALKLDCLSIGRYSIRQPSFLHKVHVQWNVDVRCDFLIDGHCISEAVTSLRDLDRN